MAAAFLIARSRGLDELATQIGFFVIINLVFTFSVNSISVGAPHRRADRRRDRGAASSRSSTAAGSANAKAIEIAALVGIVRGRGGRRR